MEKKNTIDLKIQGHGSSAGGKFNNVIIKGAGQIKGDVDCVTLEIYGDCELNGNLKANVVRIKGNSRIKGNLKADKLNIKGAADIEGNMSVEEVTTHGSINVNGDCNAEIFSVEGMFAVEGLLNSGKIEVKLHGPSKALEIGGEEIKVERKGKLGFFALKNMILPGLKNGLTTNSIEGDEIFLEHTQAKVVRGNNIVLEAGCEIELVEYNDSFKMDEKADVRTHRKI